MKLASLTAIALVAAVAMPALAQRTPPTPEQQAAAFDKADANKDGKLDLAEWKTTIPEAFAARLADEAAAKQAMGRRDTDKDGFLSKAEYTAPMQRPGQ